jgi:thiamine-monophosphate kinase
MTVMKLSQIGELSLLAEIRKRFEKRSPQIIVGIGDDAALLRPVKKNLLVTTDMMIEGVHFNLSFITPYQLGFKLVSVNVSDIYAMGGEPRFLLLNIASDINIEKEVIDRLFDGVHEAMKRYRLFLVGGDLSASKKGIALSATLIGYTKKYIQRSGAKVGDRIYVTGSLGDSACGLELLKKIKRPIPIEISKGQRAKSKELRINSKDTVLNAKCSKLLKDLTWKDVEPLLRRHLIPEARNPKKFILNATSMIDISDGLLIDLSRLCDESKVGARIYVKNIHISSQLKKVASCLGISPIRLALSGGEDYEMLFTAPSSKRVNAIYIGDITESERVIVYPSGRKRKFSAEGYQHFCVQR